MIEEKIEQVKQVASGAVLTPEVVIANMDNPVAGSTIKREKSSKNKRKSQKINYSVIKDKYVYSADDLSFHSLAKFFGVTIRMICLKAKEEDWDKQRRLHRENVQAEVARKILRSQAAKRFDCIVKTVEALDKMEKFLFKKCATGEQVEIKSTWAEYKSMMAFFYHMVGDVDGKKLPENIEVKTAEDMTTRLLERIRNQSNPIKN